MFRIFGGVDQGLLSIHFVSLYQLLVFLVDDRICWCHGGRGFYAPTVAMRCAIFFVVAGAEGVLDF